MSGSSSDEVETSVYEFRGHSEHAQWKTTSPCVSEAGGETMGEAGLGGSRK